jgi:hypothetical protein
MAKRSKRNTARRGTTTRRKMARPRRSVSKKTMRATAKKRTKTVSKATARRPVPRKRAARQPRQAMQEAGSVPELKPKGDRPTETVIVDVVEEPAPGVVVVSEFEATRVVDSEEE